MDVRLVNSSEYTMADGSRGSQRKEVSTPTIWKPRPSQAAQREHRATHLAPGLVLSDSSRPTMSETSVSDVLGLHKRRGRDSNPRQRFKPLKRFSRPPHSTALPPLRGDGRRLDDLLARGRRGRRGRSYRREAKNSLSSSPHSCARRPPATSGRWFKRGSPSTSSTLPQAPAFGSAAP
jgi:hypothetical protein